MIEFTKPLPPIKELEISLIQVGGWNTAPQEALKVVKRLCTQYGGDIGIGYHDKIGYYVLHNQGDESRVVWRENRL